MGYIKRKARNVGFHSKRHAQRAAAGEVQKVLTKVAKFGLTVVTIKRHAQAFKRIAAEHFPAGLEHVRERSPGVLHLRAGGRAFIEPSMEERAARRAKKLRANYAGRMAEVG